MTTVIPHRATVRRSKNPQNPYSASCNCGWKSVGWKEEFAYQRVMEHFTSLLGK